MTFRQGTPEWLAGLGFDGANSNSPHVSVPLERDRIHGYRLNEGNRDQKAVRENRRFRRDA
jgi:hypothetical protein